MRVVYSAIVKKTDRELLLNGIEKSSFMCGGYTGKLFEKEFAIVSTEHVKYSTQIPFFNRFRVVHNLCCDSVIEKSYYNDRLKKIVHPICYKCGCDLTNYQDILTETNEKKQTYRIVLPSCKSEKCGGFKCERKRPVKRSAQGAAAKPAKKKKRVERGSR